MAGAKNSNSVDQEEAADITGRNISLLLTILCQSFQAFFLAGIPLLLPMIREDLDLTFAQGGSLVAVSCFIYAFMQIPAGYLAGRFNPRRLVFIGTLGMTILSLALGFVESYPQIIAVQVLFGFSSAFVLIPAMSVFIEWLPPHNSAVATVLPMTGIGLGVLAVNLVFPQITEAFASWRAPFIILSFPGIISSFCLLILGRDPDKRSGTKKMNIRDIPEILRLKQVWICCGLQFIRFGVVQGVVFWLPSLLTGEKNFSLKITGAIMAMQSIISAPSNLVGAYLSDRLGKPVLIIGISMIMLFITTGLLVPINTAGLIIAVVIVNGIFLQIYFGPLFSIPIEALGKDKAGVSNGMGNMFANIGGLSVAYLMGVIKDATGSFEYGFKSICGLCAVGLTLAVMLSRLRNVRTADTQEIISPPPRGS